MRKSAAGRRRRPEVGLAARRQERDDARHGARPAARPSFPRRCRPISPSATRRSASSRTCSSAYAHDNAKLEAFAAFYNDLMLAPSGLSKLEREMIAVAVSSREPMLSTACRPRRRRAPALGRSGARRDAGHELSGRRPRAPAPGHARLRGEAHARQSSAVEEEDREALRAAGLLRPRHLGHRGRGLVLQHVEPHGLRRRYAPERRIPRAGAVRAVVGRRVPFRAGRAAG